MLLALVSVSAGGAWGLLLVLLVLIPATHVAVPAAAVSSTTPAVAVVVTVPVATAPAVIIVVASPAAVTIAVVAAPLVTSPTPWRVVPAVSPTATVAVLLLLLLLLVVVRHDVVHVVVNDVTTIVAVLASASLLPMLLLLLLLEHTHVLQGLLLFVGGIRPGELALLNGAQHKLPVLALFQLILMRLNSLC